MFGELEISKLLFGGLIYWLARDSTCVDNQSNDAGMKCFCYKAFQLGFALCVGLAATIIILQYFLFSSSTIYLHTGRYEAGVSSYIKFPSRKGGGGE